MDFEFSDTDQAVREATETICRRFDDAYWLEPRPR